MKEIWVDNKENYSIIGPVLPSWGGLHVGGVSNQTQGLANALANIGCQITVLGDNSTWKSQNKIEKPPQNLTIHHMKYLPFDFVSLVNNDFVSILLMLYRLILYNKLNIPLFQKLRYGYRSINYNYFLQRSKPSLIHVAHVDFRPFIVRDIIKHTKPVIATMHSATNLIRNVPDWVKDMTIMQLNAVDAVITCSNFVTEFARQSVNDQNKIHLIHNAVDINKFFPMSKHKARIELLLDKETFYVLFVGAMVRSKGTTFLLNAFIKIAANEPDIQLIFIGLGPEIDSIKLLARQASILDRVLFVGNLANESISKWYAACDVFVLPSESEGLSVAILEALACGVPVITTDPGKGCHDAVEQNENGLLVKYNDVDALANAITHLHKNRDVLQEMGVNGRRKAEKMFSWEVNVRKTLAVYEEVLQIKNSDPIP